MNVSPILDSFTDTTIYGSLIAPATHTLYVGSTTSFDAWSDMHTIAGTRSTAPALGVWEGTDERVSLYPMCSGEDGYVADVARAIAAATGNDCVMVVRHATFTDSDTYRVTVTPADDGNRTIVNGQGYALTPDPRGPFVAWLAYSGVSGKQPI